MGNGKVQNGAGRQPARKKMSKKALARNIVILFVSLVFLTGGVLCVYADQLLSSIDYSTEEPEGPGLFQSTAPDPTSSGESSGTAPTGEFKKVNGLYHDDSIVNVLLLGVDDYKKNDTGRSDSMMLVSIDTRHNKLKLTSFLRDMFVPIPGLGSGGAAKDKLNASYSLFGGGEKGAAKVVQTVEANFSIDIDRWVLISDSSFDKIINVLGGVEINLTEAEANEFNKHFGYSGSQKMKAGTQILNAEHAHYYSRIRHVGSDFARTSRQRNVLTSIVNQFKSSDIFTIKNLMVEILPLVKTNLTKNEILMLVGNALTYMNYSMEESHVPGDDAYTFSMEYLYSSPRTKQSVEIVDFKKSTKSLVKFIYEQDIG